MEGVISAMTNDPVLIFLPILIAIEVILGIIVAIRSKTFDIKKLPKFMINGVLYLGFMIVMNLIYAATMKGDFGDIATITIQTIRGAAWIFVIAHYLKGIYDNLVSLGLRRSDDVEQKLNKMYSEVAKETSKEVIREIAEHSNEDSLG